MQWLHLIVDVFAAGRSSLKIAMFAALAAAFVVAHILLRFRPAGSDAKKPSRIGRVGRNARSFAVLAAALFLFGLALTAYAYATTGVSPDRLLVAMSERDISVTQLFHSHAMKYAFGSVSALLPAGLRIALERSADFGFANGMMLPAWTGYVGFAGFLGLALFGFGAFVDFVRAHRRAFLRQLLLLVALFSVIKNVFDGGILNHEAVPACLLLLLLLFGDRLEKGKNMLWAVALQILPFCAVAFGCAKGYITLEGAAQYLSHVCGLELFFIGLFVWADARFSKGSSIVLVLSGLFFLSQVLSLSASGISYASQPLLGKLAYVATYDAAWNGGKPIEKIGDLSIYSVPGISDMTVGDLAKLAGEPLLYLPVSIERSSCKFGEARSEFQFDVLSKEPLASSGPDHRFASLSASRAGDQNGWTRYAVTVRSSPCAPRMLGVTDELLKEAGGKEVLAIPLVRESVITY